MIKKLIEPAAYFIGGIVLGYSINKNLDVKSTMNYLALGTTMIVENLVVKYEIGAASFAFKNFSKQEKSNCQIALNIGTAIGYGLESILK